MESDTDAMSQPRIPSDTRSIEERLWQLESERAIRELVHVRADATDREDWDRYQRVFHKGGTQEVPGLYTKSLQTGNTADRKQLRFSETFHQISNVEVRVSGTKAVCQCYWVGHHFVPAGMELDFLPENRQPTIAIDQDLILWIGGRYFDQLAYENDRWGITHRTSIHDWQEWNAVESRHFVRFVDLLPPPVDQLLTSG